MLPVDGAIIAFTTTPIGSYASVGQAYSVTVRGEGRNAYVYLRNVAKGSGTFDRGWAYKSARFEEISAH